MAKQGTQNLLPDNYHLPQGQMPYEIVTSETPNISEYSASSWYEPICCLLAPCVSQGGTGNVLFDFDSHSYSYIPDISTINDS